MKTSYELETLGWKITQLIYNNRSYNIFHPWYFPYGYEMKDKTLREVLEFIDNFIKEDQHKEEIERFNLDR